MVVQPLSIPFGVSEALALDDIGGAAQFSAEPLAPALATAFERTGNRECGRQVAGSNKPEAGFTLLYGNPACFDTGQLQRPFQRRFGNLLFAGCLIQPFRNSIQPLENL